MSLDLSAAQACARLMNLERPIVFLDLETTGLDVSSSRIIEIAMFRITPDQSFTTLDSLVNPGIPIPPPIEDLTGITNEDVSGEPGFAELTNPINELIRDADLAGYNALNFDVPLLEQEFQRHNHPMAGPPDRTVLDPCRLFKKHEPHSLERAVQFYTGKTDNQSHRAMDDTLDTLNVLAVQLTRYGLSGSADDIARHALEPYLDTSRKLKEQDGAIVFCFGKHKGKTLREIQSEEPDYVQWAIHELNAEVSRILRTALDDLEPDLGSPDPDDPDDEVPF